jgi:hypothetical protein
MSFGPDLKVDSCHEEDQLITEILLIGVLDCYPARRE